MLCCCTVVCAQEKSQLQKEAEAVDPAQNIAKARSLYIHAFNDYANKGQTRPGVECAVKATAMYYKENFYQEAFDLLRRVDQTIEADQKAMASQKAAMHYLTSKERMQMYVKMKRAASALDQLNIMEGHARQASDEGVSNDLLYSKAIYYYTFGQNAQGNAVFKEMADKLTAAKDYDKVDEVYQTLIANGRKSGNASMVAQSYSSYIAWKDSVNALKVADQIGALNQQIADHEATIEEKDSTLAYRQAFIVGLGILAAILAGALVIGAIILLRYIVLTRKQKKTIRLADETNALKAKFISNIATHLEPSLKRLSAAAGVRADGASAASVRADGASAAGVRADGASAASVRADGVSAASVRADGFSPSVLSEVQALLDFTNHIQTLSELENNTSDGPATEDTQIAPFCDAMMDHIRNKVRNGVNLSVTAQKMSVSLNKDYVSHILQHLLDNAAEYTPEGGTVSLEFKKRSPHTYQFLVTNTGESIPEEQRDNLFKPFVEIRDLTKGDGLGLPICKKMAQKMNGDLDLDTKFTKGTRFVLDLHV